MAVLQAILFASLVAVSSRVAIAVTIVQQPSAPVAISRCTLERHFVQVANGVSVQGFRTGVVFTNVGSKPIEAVVFEFTMIDTSGTFIDHHSLISTGTYVPNVEIDNISWLIVDTWPTLGAMDCAIHSVAFTDGTSWVPSSAPSPSPPPSGH